jgi:hypothetical protein
VTAPQQRQGDNQNNRPAEGHKGDGKGENRGDNSGTKDGNGKRK